MAHTDRTLTTAFSGCGTRSWAEGAQSLPGAGLGREKPTLPKRGARPETGEDPGCSDQGWGSHVLRGSSFSNLFVGVH